MFINKITTRTTDPMLGFVRRERQIEIILLVQNTRKYILDEFFCSFTPSKSVPCLFSNLSDDNYFVPLKQTIKIIVKGRTVELRNMQKPERVTPIISPFEVTSAVLKFKYPLIMNSIMPSSAIPYKLL